MIETLGVIIAVLGSALGLIGAWGTSSKIKRTRHFGFTCWMINSPLIIISMIGIAIGIWEGMNVWAFVPLNLVYWGTAARGFLNTREAR
jgi:hypothetical protein